jgi:hypothetical protein
MKERTMTDVATVAVNKPGTGAVARRYTDGRYALAEQLEAKQLPAGERPAGRIVSE